MKYRVLKGQRGQAMTELIVAGMFFLVPLFLAISAIGKFADVQHTAYMGARYATWERTVWYNDAGSPGSTFDGINNPNAKTDVAIQNEMAVRIINSHSGKPVISNTDGTATSFVNGTDPLWNDDAHTAYLDTYANVTNAASMAAPGGDFSGTVLSGISSVIDNVPGLSSLFGSVVPPLPSNTLATVNVSFSKIAATTEYARLWPTGDPGGGAWKGINVTAPGAILSNTWGANGVDATKRMVRTSVPTANLLGTTLQATVQGPMMVWDPVAMSGLDVGKVAPDVTPSDRLINH
ncbi:MAG: hypothetical protein JO218_01790 [Burkholderiales bacterium]|nr:hypothetical protein [Burkholderiales bacterium]